MTTQCDRVANYMRQHGSITQLEAYNELGVFRLASRINDLRRYGYNIVSKSEEVKNKFGEKCKISRYTLLENNA